jgi:hypothetical protein
METDSHQQDANTILNPAVLLMERFAPGHPHGAPGGPAPLWAVTQFVLQASQQQRVGIWEAQGWQSGGTA